MENMPFVASWSGGKDSAMAYYRVGKRVVFRNGY